MNEEHINDEHFDMPVDEYSDVYIDRKVTIWRRDHYRVKGDREKQESLLVEEAISPSYEYGDEFKFTESEILFETESQLTREENNGEPVVEIFFEDGSCISMD